MFNQISNKAPKYHSSVSPEFGPEIVIHYPVALFVGLALISTVVEVRLLGSPHNPAARRPRCVQRARCLVDAGGKEIVCHFRFAVLQCSF